MAIKEQQTSYREYYKLYRTAMEAKYQNALENCDKLKVKLEEVYKTVTDKIDLYKNKCKFNLKDYDEYNQNQYIDGELETDVKRLFVRYSNQYENKFDLIQLYNYVNVLKKLSDAIKEKDKYRRCANIKLSEYHDLLFKYMMEVHKAIILNGEGYSLGATLGVVIINRCKLVNARSKIDFAATKANKKKLIAEGQNIFNKDEADFCAVNGIDYKGVDYRVFMNKDYVYEIPLIFKRFKNAHESKFIVTDFRQRSIRGKSNEELINECGRDTKKIAVLPLDIRTKLTMCLEVDKMLYSKFIRNEGQKPVATSKAYRKN